MMSRNDDYKPGNPEYDYWNDKNLYPSLQHDGDYTKPKRSASSDDAKIGLGSVFFVIFVWLLVFAPFAFFLSWGNWITQVVFWGGLAIIILVFILWLGDAIEDCKVKRNSQDKLNDDPSLPWYKKYPPADVVQSSKEKSMRDKKS